MKNRFVHVALYSYIGLILVLSLFVSSALFFHANSLISLLIFFFVFMLTLNFLLIRNEKAQQLAADKNQPKPPVFNRILLLLFYSGMVALCTIPISHALFALQTQYFGEEKKLILKGEITHPPLTFSRNPCMNRLKFPKSHWSTLNYLCVDTDPTYLQKNGYYQLDVKTSFFGSNITHFQWIDDQITPAERISLDMDPALKQLLEGYAKLEKGLGPPLTEEEVPVFMEKLQKQEEQ